MQDGARLRAQHCREVAAHFRSLADVEPAESLRRQLGRLAARHDQLAADLEPQADGENAPRAALGLVREAIDAEPYRIGPRIKKLRGLLAKLDPASTERTVTPYPPRPSAELRGAPVIRERTASARLDR